MQGRDDFADHKDGAMDWSRWGCRIDLIWGLVAEVVEARVGSTPLGTLRAEAGAADAGLGGATSCVVCLATPSELMRGETVAPSEMRQGSGCISELV